MNDDQQRKLQDYVDKLPDSERNDKARETFDELTKKSAQPSSKAPEGQDKPAPSGYYNDKQTPERKAEDTSDSHNGTSHQ